MGEAAARKSSTSWGSVRNVLRANAAISGQANPFIARRRIDDKNLEIMSPADRKKWKLKKDNCRIVRNWVFGHVNGKGVRTPPAVMDEVLEKACQERLGRQAVVQELYNHWVKMDTDASGTIDFEEFDDYSVVLRQKNNDFEVMRDKDKLMQALFRNDTSFTLDHLIKLIWPAATDEDVLTMKSWFKQNHVVVEEEKRKKEVVGVALVPRVPTPEPMPFGELEGLQTMFNELDQDQTGKIKIGQLVNAGVVQDLQRQ